MKKVTMQNIADALKISRLTVWKVFNHQSGVSEVLKNQVLSKAEELGYFKFGIDNKSEAEYETESKSFTISVVVSRPDSAVFWMNIIHRIAKELAKFDAILMYTYLPSSYTSGYVLPKVLTNGTIKGFLVLNVYDDTLLKMLADVELPKVFLDTTSSYTFEKLKGDLILLEGRHTIDKLTSHLINKGCRNLGFIGDIAYAKTNKDRFDGFLDALKRHDIVFKSETSLTKNLEITCYASEINQFLEQLKQLPQAFICASDYVANFVLHYLNEHDINVPSDIVLTGYDCSAEYFEDNGFLTTVDVKTHDLGKRLVRQLLYRLEVPDAAYEIIYIYSNIIYGISTEI